MKNIFILSLLLLTFVVNHLETRIEESILNSNMTPAKKTQNSFQESQLIGKWYFLSKDNDQRTKLQNLTDGKYLLLKKNKKYKSDLFEKNAFGKWKFNEELQILVFECQSKKTKWNLVNLNEFGMVLINSVTNEKWIFALEE